MLAETVLAALAELFAELAARGHLRPGDPVMAAEHFAFLVMGADLDRGMFAAQHFRVEQVRRRALGGVDVFLRAYAAPATTARPVDQVAGGG